MSSEILSVLEYLEKEKGFKAEWFRTDFRFTTREMMYEIVEPVFGEEMLVLAHRSQVKHFNDLSRSIFRANRVNSRA